MPMRDVVHLPIRFGGVRLFRREHVAQRFIRAQE